jgi:hypothetical protein
MEAVTEFFVRLSQACYVICKDGSCYDASVISYLVNTNNQDKQPSKAVCPPTVEMFEKWQKGTGYFELGVAKFKCMMEGRGMEWAQHLLERVFQHTTEYSVAEEGSLNHLQNKFEERRQIMEWWNQRGNIWMEEQIYPGWNLWMERRIHPYLDQKHQNSPPFVLAIQAGAQGSDGTDSGQDVESASCFFEKLSSDENEVRRKSINARTLWLYKKIKLCLGVHSMRKVSEDLNLWRTFNRENDSEDEDSSSDLHDEVYASDSAEFRLDVLFDSQGGVDLYDASQVMSSD